MKQKQITIKRSIIKDIIRRYQTPLYVYDNNVMKNSFLSLKDTFSEKTDILYSFKANPNLSICHEFFQLGTGAEVCSLYELQIALKVGFSPKNIIFLGPAKTNEEILCCLRNDIYAIVCESLNEMKLISKLARNCNKLAKIILRVNPNFYAKDAQLKMGGKPTQFGIDQDELLNNEPLFFNLPNIDLIGLHVYNGTRILNASVIANNTSNVLELASIFSERWKIKWKVIDIGGGIGIPYFKDEAAIDLGLLKVLLQPILQKFFQANQNTRVILESGRYLIGSSGYLFARVLDIKQSKGENFIVTDAGANCFAAATGFNSIFVKNFPISIISNKKNLKDEYDFFNITGPLCTPGDIIAKKIQLQKPSVGDIVCIHDAGAYGLTASPIFFLSHKNPAEIMVKDNTPYLVRERFGIEDILRHQHMILTAQA